MASLVGRLEAIAGVKAVVLGGSHARGRARSGSDIDLYIFYQEANPFAITDIRALAEAVNDTSGPVVTDFYEWGPWVNGGAWLTIGGQRVDFVYRSLEHVERVIADAEAGRYEQHYAQQPPFGFFSGAYLGEIATCAPLLDSDGRINELKPRVANYPDALRCAVVQDYLWQVELSLTAFAPRFAERAGAYGTAACIVRIVNQLLLALFALNRQHFMDDKTALMEIGELECVPHRFSTRVQQLLGHVGNSPEELNAALTSAAQLFRETVALTEGLYEARFVLPM
jgi:hypothetical protein